jgi:hypothetical protein
MSMFHASNLNYSFKEGPLTSPPPKDMIILKKGKPFNLAMKEEKKLG